MDHHGITERNGRNEPTDPDVEPEDLRPPPPEPGPFARRAARRSAFRAQAPVLAVVSAGGALGALARYALSLAWPTAPGAFPWTTLVVNATGCLVIGVFMVVISDVWAAHRLVRPFFGTGVLGGFTTFSTYAVDIQRLFTDPGGAAAARTALLYLVATAVAAMVCVAAGAAGARRVIARTTGRTTGPRSERRQA